MEQSPSCNSRIWLMKKESTGNTGVQGQSAHYSFLLSHVRSRVGNLFVPSSHGIFVKFRNNGARNLANISEQRLSKNGQVIFVGVFVSTMGDNYHQVVYRKLPLGNL